MGPPATEDLQPGFPTELNLSYPQTANQESMAPPLHFATASCYADCEPVRDLDQIIGVPATAVKADSGDIVHILTLP